MVKAIRHAALSFLAAALACSGCGLGGLVGRGIARYREGDYVSAMQVWSDVAPYERDLNHKGLVRYLVYRGLTHYRRGEARLALLFLSRGREAYRLGSPEWLPTYTMVEMNRALAALSGGTAARPPPARPLRPSPQGTAPEPGR